LSQCSRDAVEGGSGAAISFTRVSAMAPFTDFLDSIGAPTGRLSRQARIPVGLFEEPEALVPLHLAHGFGEVAARSEGIEDLGLVVAQQTSAFDLGDFGKSLQRASTSDMSIAEIAGSLGYTDAANFARAFRRRKGMSPRSFRQIADDS
jgi:hypothetical protein